MDVFVYGTLTDPDRVETVLDDYEFLGPAVLDGFHRVDGDYPTLAPGGRVDGRLLRTDAIATLDDYERVDRGWYDRVTLPVAVDVDGCGPTVETYVGDPDVLAAPVEWPGEGSVFDRVRAFVDTNDVTVRAVDVDAGSDA